MRLEAAFAERMAALLPDPPAALGLAVSGGSDSTALMELAALWAAERAVALRVATVDHGLRPEAAAEAAAVAARAAALGLGHDTLGWTGWDGRGNLQDAARRARRALLWRWSRSHGLGHILLGHTMDDQAETVLRNLGRGSGVAGLSGMAERVALPWPADEADPGGHAPWLLRPLLGLRRAALRDWLVARGQGWAEDPSNEDARFDRVRARRALAEGVVPGLTVEGLAATAARMARARRALSLRTGEAAARLAAVDAGAVVLDRAGLAALDAETRLALLAHALVWVSSAEYRPRAGSLEALATAAMAGRGGTLLGCRVTAEGDRLRVAREWKAVAGLRAPARPGAVWDRRWRLASPGFEGLEIAAATPAALATWPDWPAEAPPRRRFEGAPALWQGARMVALPGVAGPPCRFDLAPPVGSFHAALTSGMLSH